MRTLPDAMRDVLGRREAIADAARRLAPPKRYWAVVGNGPNKVAAEEVAATKAAGQKKMAETRQKKAVDMAVKKALAAAAKEDSP